MTTLQVPECATLGSSCTLLSKALPVLCSATPDSGYAGVHARFMPVFSAYNAKALKLPVAPGLSHVPLISKTRTHHILHVGSWWRDLSPHLVVIVQNCTHVPWRYVSLSAAPWHPDARQKASLSAAGWVQQVSGIRQHKGARFLYNPEDQATEVQVHMQ